MPRINVLAERKITDNRYSHLDLPNQEVELVWRNRSIRTEEIYAFEQISEKYILVEMNGGEQFRIKEAFQEFDDRIYEAELPISFEFIGEEGEQEEIPDGKENT